MKLAYIGYDKNIFKSYKYLAQYFQDIDSYLINYDNSVTNTDLLDLPIIAQNVYVGKKPQLHTNKQKATLAEIEDEFLKFKESINQSELIEVVNHETKINKRYFRLKDVLSIQFDKISNNHLIETKIQGQFEYDYIIIENHKLVSDLLKEKKQDLYKGVSNQAYVMLNLDFSVVPKIGKVIPDQEFIFVANSVIKSIFDNWYICKIDCDKISINFYIPFSQQHSEDLINFLTQRTRNVFSSEFVTFELGEVLSKSIIATSGFASQSMKVKDKKKSSILPSFAYWSENRVAGYIHNLLINKNKKNKLFFEKELKK